MKAVGHVRGGDGQPLVVEGERVLRHRRAVDRGGDELEVAAVEPEVGSGPRRAVGIAAEGDLAPDPRRRRVEREGELDPVGEKGRRAVVGEPDGRGLSVDAHLTLLERKAPSRAGCIPSGSGVKGRPDAPAGPRPRADARLRVRSCAFPRAPVNSPGNSGALAGDKACFWSAATALFDFFLESEDGPGAATYAARAGGSPFNVAIGLARLGADARAC